MWMPNCIQFKDGAESSVYPTPIEPDEEAKAKQRKPCEDTAATFLLGCLFQAYRSPPLGNVVVSCSLQRQSQMVHYLGIHALETGVNTM